jgi:hypothetical protein
MSLLWNSPGTALSSSPSGKGNELGSEEGKALETRLVYVKEEKNEQVFYWIQPEF